MFYFVLQTPERVYFEGEVDSVLLQTELGEMEIFSNHASLIGAVEFSRVVAKRGDTQDVFFVRQGTVHVNAVDDSVDILVMSCEKEEAVTFETLKEYRELIVEKLANKESLSDLQVRYLEDQAGSLEKALEVVVRKK